MSAPLRIGMYGALLVIVFVVAFFTAGALVPADMVRTTVEQTQTAQTDDTRDAPHQGGDDDH